MVVAIVFFLLFFLPPLYYDGRNIPGPSPKTHAILLRVAVEGADLIIIVNNAVLKTKDDFTSESKQKSGHLVPVSEW